MKREPKKSLTDQQIKNLRSPERGQKTYYDKALPGFGVRVSQGGTKTFVVVYGLNRQRRSIGRYPEMSLAEARARAKGIQSEFALESPLEHIKPEISYQDARRMFLEDSETRNKPRTVGEYRRLLHRHFGFNGPLDEIDRHAILRRLDKLKGTPAEQQHAFVAIRTLMNWCWKRGYIEASPVPPLTFKQRPRDRVLSDDELVSIWRHAGAIGYPFGSIVQLLILTGQRRGEIVNLRRSWIGKDTIIFPAAFVKNSREHALPLTESVRHIVDKLPETADLLFPSRLSDAKPFDGFSRAKRNFDRDILVSPYTLHDLRRTFSSNLARLGTPIHVTEKLLNHISGTVSGISAVYNRYSYLDEMRAAMQRHDDFLAELTIV